MALTEAPRLTAESAPSVGFLIAVKQISNANLGSQTFWFEKSLPVGQRKSIANNRVLAPGCVVASMMTDSRMKGSESAPPGQPLCAQNWMLNGPFPGMLKTIVSSPGLALAASIAAPSEPATWWLELVLVTVNVIPAHFSIVVPRLDLLTLPGSVPKDRDSEGLEHAVEVAAASLYEAAVMALAEFLRCGFADASFGPGTRLTVKRRKRRMS